MNFPNLLVVTLLSNAVLFASPIYTTSIIAQTGDIVGGQTLTGVVGNHPGINNNDQVAYEGFYNGGAALFVDHTAVQRTGDVVSGVTLTGLGSPSIDSAGILSYRGYFGATAGIFTTGTLLVQEGAVIGGKTVTFFNDPTSNDSGTVVFYSLYRGAMAFSPKTAPWQP